MESMKVTRKDSDGEYKEIFEPPYRFDDIAEYSCAVGFRNEEPSLKSYCHGRRGWTTAAECRSMNFNFVSVQIKTDDFVSIKHVFCLLYIGRNS